MNPESLPRSIYQKPKWCEEKSERDREMCFMIDCLHDIGTTQVLDVGFAGAGYIEMLTDIGIDYTGMDGDLGRITGQSICYAAETRKADIKRWNSILSKIKYIHADVIEYDSDFQYELVMSISAIEHIVPIEYDYHYEFDFYRDLLAVKSMKKLAKNYLLLTFPCGIEYILSNYHDKLPDHLKHKWLPSGHSVLIYNEDRIKKVIGDWTIIKEQYWTGNRGIYEEASKEEVLNFDCKKTLHHGLCALLLGTAQGKGGP